MGILKKSTFVALLLILLTIIFSCELSSEDGRWDPMEWTSDRPGDSRKITATAESGARQLKCTSYGGPWISSVTDTDTVTYAGDKKQGFRRIKYDWYDILAKENTFYIILLPNTTDKERKLPIDVTTGDILGRIEVTQDR